MTLAATRSWWEHWSSGVVLILLIIALVTASILALNDGGKSKQEQLASDSVSAALDDFDLSNITIPDIAVNKSEPVGHAEQAVVGADPQSRGNETDITASADGSESREIKEISVAAQAAGNDANSNTKKSGESAGAMASLAPPLNANITAQPTLSPTNATLSEAPQAAKAVAPLATLALPLGVSPAPLFDSATSFATDSRPATSVSLPSLSGSAVGAAKNHNDATATADKTTAPASSEAGASPQLYDGAQLATELHASGVERRVETADAGRDGPVDTNLPSYATILASATQPLASGAEKLAGPVAAAPTSTPAPTGTTDPYGRPGVVTTATPDLDTQAIINAYLPYSQTNKAQNGEVSNRFIPAAGQTPLSAPTSQPSGRGFTLGN